MLDSVPVQHLPDVCALLVNASYTEKIQVLDAVDISERFKKTLPLLMRQIEVWSDDDTDCLAVSADASSNQTCRRTLFIHKTICCLWRNWSFFEFCDFPR